LAALKYFTTTTKSSCSSQHSPFPPLQFAPNESLEKPYRKGRLVHSEDF
jgi:hypothetical protein